MHERSKFTAATVCVSVGLLIFCLYSGSSTGGSWPAVAESPSLLRHLQPKAGEAWGHGSNSNNNQQANSRSVKKAVMEGTSVLDPLISEMESTLEAQALGGEVEQHSNKGAPTDMTVHVEGDQHQLDSSQEETKQPNPGKVEDVIEVMATTGDASSEKGIIEGEMVQAVRKAGSQEIKHGEIIDVDEEVDGKIEEGSLEGSSRERIDGGDASAASPSFFTYPTVGNVDLLCKPSSICKDCHRSQPLLRHMLANSKPHVNETELFLVPLDPLAVHRKKPYMYFKMLDKVIKEVTYSREYLRFGGSDHVFICLADACKHVMQDIVDRYPIGSNARAMWVGREYVLQDIRDGWPCPNRVFSAPEALLKGLGWPAKRRCTEVDEALMKEGLAEVLNEMVKQNEGMNRWECSRSYWDIDLEPLRGKKHQGCMAITRHKICVSGIPKCASSTMNILLKRMMGNKDWNDPNGHTHGPLNGIKWVNSWLDFDEYKQIMESTEWVKIAVVREPAARFLSAYVDKIVKKKEYGRIGFKPTPLHKEPSFEWAVKRFMRVKAKGRMGAIDLHFRPMHHFGSLRMVRYDFMARVETLADDMETILSSLDLWDLYGASGWGEDGSLSFKEAKGRNVQHDGLQYYTEDLLRKVHQIYKQDYRLFGFSMEDEWGVLPS